MTRFSPARTLLALALALPAGLVEAAATVPSRTVTGPEGQQVPFRNRWRR